MNRNCDKKYKSIDKIATYLYAISQTFPDLRIGQIIKNFHCYMKSKGLDVFYFSDDKYSSFLQDYLLEVKRNEM